MEKNLSQYEKRNDTSIATASEMTVSNGINKSCRRLCDISYQLSVSSSQSFQFLVRNYSFLFARLTKHFLFNFLENDMAHGNMSFLNALCIVRWNNDGKINQILRFAAAFTKKTNCC